MNSWYAGHRSYNKAKSSTADIGVEALQYSTFVSILKEDMKYEESEETIYYRSSDDIDVMLICERS